MGQQPKSREPRARRIRSSIIVKGGNLSSAAMTKIQKVHKAGDRRVRRIELDGATRPIQWRGSQLTVHV